MVLPFWGLGQTKVWVEIQRTRRKSAGNQIWCKIGKAPGRLVALIGRESGASKIGHEPTNFDRQVGRFAMMSQPPDTGVVEPPVNEELHGMYLAGANEAFCHLKFLVLLRIVENYERHGAIDLKQTTLTCPPACRFGDLYDIEQSGI